MFGGKKRREAKIKRLGDAVEAAQAAVAGAEPSNLELVFAELSDALLSAPDNPSSIDRHDPHLDSLKRRGWDLYAQLDKRLDTTVDRDIGRRLGPCPRCGGREILVSEVAWIDTLFVANKRPAPGEPHAGGADLRFTIAVCRACADIRLTATDPATLSTLTTGTGQLAFRTLVVEPGPGSPYR